MNSAARSTGKRFTKKDGNIGSAGLRNSLIFHWISFMLSAQNRIPRSSILAAALRAWWMRLSIEVFGTSPCLICLKVAFRSQGNVLGNMRQSRQYDLLHDRATFHFLTEAADQNAYVEHLITALRPGGHAIIGTFAIDGPERCSGLPVVRYDAAALSAALGRTFALIETRRHEHKTPAGVIQRFQFSVFKRV